MPFADLVRVPMTVEYRLEPEAAQQLKPLWDYLAISERPVSADAIFVFGSRDFAVPDRAAELYHAGYAPRVLVTGSYGRLTRDVFPKPEALVFKDRLVAAGVPQDAVITEDKAANTLENVRLGMDALKRSGVSARRLLLVAKGFVMRRCVATFAGQFDGLTVVPCPPSSGVQEPLNRNGSEFSARLAWEVDRLERYAAKGDIRQEEIPDAIRILAARLREEHPRSGVEYP